MTDHPAPGAPLSAAGVGLLKRGDLLWFAPTMTEGVFISQHEGVIAWQARPREMVRHNSPGAFTFIGRPDADGWIAWSGGENPVPGVRVDYRMKDHPYDPSELSDRLRWDHDGRGGDIIAFRLPTDRRAEADTPPSAGPDAGLETVAWRWKPDAVTMRDEANRGWRLDGYEVRVGKGRGGRGVSEVQPLVTRQSAAAALEAAAEREGEWKAERELLLYDLQAEREDNALVLSRAEAQVADRDKRIAELEAALRTARGFHQVTHIHAALDQALSAIPTPGRSE